MSDISATRNQSIFDRIFPASWPKIGVMVVVLLIFVSLVVTLDGLWVEFFSKGYWSRILTAPTIIIYILIVGNLLAPIQRRAVESLRKISALDDDTYDRLLQETQAKTDKGATPALIIGFAFGFLLSVPWVLVESFSWVNLYFPVVNSIMFGLLTLVIQQSFAEGNLSNRLLQSPLKFDIFYTAPFIPIGLNSLAVALAFVGGSTIVIFFSAAGRLGFELGDIILHSVLIMLTILIFFIPLRPTHRALRTAKLAEQDNLKRQMAAAYRRLEAMTDAEKEDILSFATEVNLWLGYEERLKEVPTWPYNAGMLRTLFVSILLPILVTLGQRLLAYLLVELGIN